jgi:hypothetical protein
MMSDPLTSAVMAADGVDPQELAATLQTLVEQLERRS